MTVAQAPEAEIAAVAREEGMLTLREDGLAKVRARPDQPRGGAPCHRLTASAFGYRGIGPRSRSKAMDFDFSEVLRRMVEAQASDVHLTAGRPAGDPRQGQDRADGGLPGAHRPGDPRGRLQHPQRRPAQTLRERQTARLRLRDPRRRPLPRQLLLPARLGQRRLPPRAAGHPGARLARRAAGAARADRANRAASSSSPARPARARSRPWRR